MPENSNINADIVLGCDRYGKRAFDPDYYVAKNRISDITLELYNSGIPLKHIREWMTKIAGEAGELEYRLSDIRSIDEEIEFLKFLCVETEARLNGQPSPMHPDPSPKY